MPDQDSTREFAHENSTKAPEGAATGAATGGALGGTLGLLAGIGALAIPGVGPFIAAGPIVGALAGLGAGGAVGGFVGALVGMGIPEYEAKRYEGRVKEGGVLLSVHTATSERVKSAKADPRAHRRRGHLVVRRGERGRAGRDPHRHALLRRSGPAGQPSSPGAARMWRHRAFRSRCWLAPRAPCRCRPSEQRPPGGRQQRRD